MKLIVTMEASRSDLELVLGDLEFKWKEYLLGFKYSWEEDEKLEFDGDTVKDPRTGEFMEIRAFTQQIWEEVRLKSLK